MTHCAEMVKCWDNTSRPCLRAVGHTGAHNVFSKDEPPVMVTAPVKAQTWAPLCPHCHSGHIVVAAKPALDAIIVCMCYECRQPLKLDEIQFKRL